MSDAKVIPHLFHSFREFGKWVTRASRWALDRTDFSYVQNWMVIGPGNIQTVRPPALLASVGASEASDTHTAVRAWSVNLGGVDWILYQAGGGRLRASRMDGTVNYDLGAYTITDVAPWSNSVALLLGPAAFLSWDGTGAAVTDLGAQKSTTLTLAYVPQARWTLTGISGSFTAGEALTIAGAGTAGAATAVVFTSPDLTVTGQSGTITVGNTVTGVTSSATGTISVIDTQGFTVGETVTGSIAGTGTVVSYDATTSRLILSGSIADPSFVINQTVTGSISGATGVVLAVDIAGIPAGGNWISVYEDRVWIAIGRSIAFSAANDYRGAAWSVTQGSGFFTITDETLKSDITRLIAANGYLYVFGVSSIDAISNVYVPAGQTVPLFSRTNFEPVNGTPFSYSIVSFQRAILFYNVHGVHALAGVQVERISKDIDTTMQQIDPNPPGLVSASVGVSNNILIACFLLSWFDPTVSTAFSRQTLLSFHDGKWFIHDPTLSIAAGQSSTMAVTFSAYLAGEPVAVLARSAVAPGTGGNLRYTADFFGLFRGPSGQLPRKLQTALWDLGSSIHTKQIIIFGIEGDVIDLNYSLYGQVDTEPGNSHGDPVQFLPNEVVWVNNQGQTMTWVNDDGDPLIWTTPGYAFAYYASAQYGKYIGVTISGQAGDAILTGINLEYTRKDSTWKL